MTLEEHITDVFGNVRALVECARAEEEARWHQAAARIVERKEAHARLRKYQQEVSRLGDQDEPLTYGPESVHSYFADLARASLMTPNEIRLANGLWREVDGVYEKVDESYPGCSFVVPEWVPLNDMV